MLEKIKERTSKYGISVRQTSNGYYEARTSIKLGGGNSQRLQKGGKTEESAILSLLIQLEEYLDNSYRNGLIICKLEDVIAQRLIQSINDMEIISAEITEKVLLVTKKINDINAQILNTIRLQNNIMQYTNANNNTHIIPFNNNVVANNTPTETPKLCVLETFIKDWLEYKLALCTKTTENPKPLSRKTIDGYARKVNDVILPYFRKNKKVYITEATEEVIRDLLKSVNGQTSKRHTYIVLNMIFKYAIQNKKVIENPLENIKKPVKVSKTEEEKIDFIEPEEQETYLEMFEQEDTDMSILFETMLLTGLRPECACGLKWTALDLEANELVINNAYKDFIVYDDNMNPIGHERKDAPLKTRESYRRIPLNPRLKELLLKHKQRQKEIFKKSRAIRNKGGKWTENEYIFLGRTYAPYVPDTLSSALPVLCDKYNMKRITPYGLRHSFATYCSEHGMEEIVLMKLMGHSNYETTVRYYIRVSSKRKRIAMQEAYKVVFYERKAS